MCTCAEFSFPPSFSAAHLSKRCHDSGTEEQINEPPVKVAATQLEDLHNYAVRSPVKVMKAQRTTISKSLVISRVLSLCSQNHCGVAIVIAGNGQYVCWMKAVLVGHRTTPKYIKLGTSVSLKWYIWDIISA